ncbi:MAG: hypothetical protein AABW89_03600 [Nanoarchaeota archaeon]
MRSTIKGAAHITTKPMNTYMTMFFAVSRLPGSEPLEIYVMPAKSITKPAITVAAYFTRLYMVSRGLSISSNSVDCADTTLINSGDIKTTANSRTFSIPNLVGYGFCAIVML